MRFAGHRTLGSAHVCRAVGLGGEALTFEMPAGIIAVCAAGDRWTLRPRPPSWREMPEPRSRLAAAFGPTEHEIGERPLGVDAGPQPPMVPLVSGAPVRGPPARADPCTVVPRGPGHGP